MAGRVREVVNLLTTPLPPDDFLAALNPVWSTTEPAARVVGLRPETADTTTLLRRPGLRRPQHRPGQYVGVGARLDGVWHWRTYSVTSRPGDRLLAVICVGVDHLNTLNTSHAMFIAENTRLIESTRKGMSGDTTRTSARCGALGEPASSGGARSTSACFPLRTRPNSRCASAAFARRGEIAAAMSAGVLPAGTRRLDPSGSVTVIWLMGT